MFICCRAKPHWSPAHKEPLRVSVGGTRIATLWRFYRTERFEDLATGRAAGVGCPRPGLRADDGARADLKQRDIRYDRKQLLDVRVSF